MEEGPTERECERSTSWRLVLPANEPTTSRYVESATCRSTCSGLTLLAELGPQRDGDRPDDPAEEAESDDGATDSGAGVGVRPPHGQHAQRQADRDGETAGEHEGGGLGGRGGRGICHGILRVGRQVYRRAICDSRTLLTSV